MLQKRRVELVHQKNPEMSSDTDFLTTIYLGMRDGETFNTNVSPTCFPSYLKAFLTYFPSHIKAFTTCFPHIKTFLTCFLSHIKAFLTCFSSPSQQITGVTTVKEVVEKVVTCKGLSPDMYALYLVLGDTESHRVLCFSEILLAAMCSAGTDHFLCLKKNEFWEALRPHVRTHSRVYWES